jgi:hypothetical protein
MPRTKKPVKSVKWPIFLDELTWAFNHNPALEAAILSIIIERQRRFRWLSRAGVSSATNRQENVSFAGIAEDMDW